MTDQQTRSPEQQQPDPPHVTLSRRRLLGSAGAVGAVAAAAGFGVGDLVEDGGSPTRTDARTSADAADAATDKQPLTALGSARIPFYGKHQAGITDSAQAVLHATAFDLTPGTGRPGLTALLRAWTSAAAAMAEGLPAAGQPDDDVAMDSGPSSLTVTFGFGASLFAKARLTGHLPTALAPLPPFPDDRLDPARSGGDLWVQVCADDALVAWHAMRTLQRAAAGKAKPRWQMRGFSRSPGATAKPRTVRNLMGQIDGTNNPKPTDAGFAADVFVQPKDGPAWMAGGSYAVFRRIRMLLDPWEQQSTTYQERVIGRHKASGAPLSGGTETTPVDLDKVNADGSLAVPGDAHIRVAAPAANSGATMLRRGFSYHDGFRSDGSPDAGLLFIAYQSDPLTGFTAVQRKLSRADALSRFISHESSALFAVPPAAPDASGYVGQPLLES